MYSLCLNIAIFLLGIANDSSALEWIQENAPSFLKYPSKATMFAWIHTHVNGNKCFLSSIDLHSQFVYEKYFRHILAIVVEIGVGEDIAKNIQFYKLSGKGTRRVNQCNKTLNKPSIFHESCANDETLFNNITEEIVYLNKGPFEIIDARNKYDAKDLPPKKSSIKEGKI